MELNSKGVSAVAAGDDFIMVKALEDGVTIIGLTRASTKFHHTEKLDKGRF